jgi:hypothetical protein
MPATGTGQHFPGDLIGDDSIGMAGDQNEVDWRRAWRFAASTRVLLGKDSCLASRAERGADRVAVRDDERRYEAAD